MRAGTTFRSSLRVAVALIMALLATYSSAQSGAVSNGPSIGSAIERLRADPKDKRLIDALGNSLAREKSSPDHERGLAIYCAALLAAGEAGKADVVAKELRETYPTGAFKNSFTRDNLSEKCTGCEGGRVSSRCERCEGAGRCSVCRGQGRRAVQGINGARVVVCTECQNGSGKCRHCMGAGTRQALCVRCSGRGRVFSQAVVRALLLKMLTDVEQAPAVATNAIRRRLTYESALVVATQAQKAVVADLSVTSTTGGTIYARPPRVTAVRGEDIMRRIERAYDDVRWAQYEATQTRILTPKSRLTFSDCPDLITMGNWIYEVGGADADSSILVTWSELALRGAITIDTYVAGVWPANLGRGFGTNVVVLCEAGGEPAGMSDRLPQAWQRFSDEHNRIMSEPGAMSCFAVEPDDVLPYLGNVAELETMGAPFEYRWRALQARSYYNPNRPDDRCVLLLVSNGLSFVVTDVTPTGDNFGLGWKILWLAEASDQSRKYTLFVEQDSELAARQKGDEVKSDSWFQQVWVASTGLQLIEGFHVAAGSFLFPDRRGADLMKRKMEETVFPVLDFQQVSIVDVMKFLNEESVRLDKAYGVGVNIVLNLGTPGLGSGEDSNQVAMSTAPTITLSLRKVPMFAAIKYIAESVGMKWRIESNCVVITR